MHEFEQACKGFASQRGVWKRREPATNHSTQYFGIFGSIFSAQAVMPPVRL